MNELEDIDTKLEEGNTDENLMHRRLRTEAELEKLMEMDEIYWQQRGRGGGERWVLEGDSNTNFFHLVANGRKRKKMITLLEHEGEEITEKEEIKQAICSYYKQLFGMQPTRKVSMGVNAWATNRRLTKEDNLSLTRPFSEKEVKEAVFNMMENSAPGPDGFGVAFYKKFWEVVKEELMEIVNDFYMEILDISRLTYGVITLITKVKEAKCVQQFRPICLLNVIFKNFTKLLVERLTYMAQKLVDPCQTAFIKGRFIIDGVVMLHEVLHELRVKKQKGVILKIDFEKAYNSVRWDFMDEVVDRKWFGNKLKGWIMNPKP